MANKAFDRVVIRRYSRPKSRDLNRQFSQLAATNQVLLQELLSVRSGNLGTGGSSAAVGKSGFVKQGFQPVWSGSGMGIILRAGLGFRYDVTDLPTDIGSQLDVDDVAPLKPLYAPSDIAITVPASTADPRIDLIEVRQNRVLTDTEAYQYLQTPTTGAIGNGSSASTLSSVLTTADVGITSGGAASTTAVGYKQGTSHPSAPTAPTVTAGYELVGYVYVPGGSVAAIADSNVYDYRRLLGSNRVVVHVEKASGTGGALTVRSIDAPPGVRVALWNDTPSAFAGYDLYILCGNAQYMYDAGFTYVPISISSFNQDSPPGETVNAGIIGAVQALNSTFATRMAAATPAISVSADIPQRFFRAMVGHVRSDGTNIDYNISETQFDTITFDIPVV